MTRPDTYVVITVGNTASSSFWPYSRKQKPKQFLDLFNTGQSPLQATFNRCQGICPEDNIYVVVSKEHVPLVQEQLPGLGAQHILAEPVRRNAAPCIAYACYKIREHNPDALIVVTPTDHIVMGEVAFVRDVRSAVETVATYREKLLVMGIKPHKAETSYRYIQYHHDSGGPVRRIKTFTEKPQHDLAQLLLDSGDFAWNTDIYIWHVQTILAAYQQYLPEVFEIFDEGRPYYNTPEEEAFIRRAYSQCKSTSMIHGVLEKADNVYVMLGNFDWADVDSWNTLYEMKQKDAGQNVVEANAFLYDIKNSYIKGSRHKLIIVHQLEGYLVADTEDVLLICPRHMEDKIKTFTSDVRAKKGERFV